MTDPTSRYQRAKEIFLDACELPAEQQESFVAGACGEDALLLEDVRSLLHHRSTADETALLPGAAREDSREPRAMIGPYRVLHEIGKGGMGIVYLAVREDDDKFKRRVAIKVLRRGTDTEEVIRRFELERQLLAAMNHPGIARLYDAGETEDDLPWIAMEHIEGQALDEYCDQNRLDIVERLEIFRRICAAVHYAHQNLVVHRDLKPSNIIVTRDGQPKLLDFGIAKIINPQFAAVMGDPTRPELRIMTPEYASPEQVRGNPITTASDVYSLGVILYELVCGHRPYQLHKRVREEIIRIICESEPERPSTAISRVEEFHGTPTTTRTITPESVSKSRRSDRPERLRRALAGDIDDIVMMAMRKEPDRRYASAEQLGEDIRRHLAGMPVIATRDTMGYRAQKFVRRNRAGVLAAAMMALLLTGGILGTTWGMQRARTEAARAERRFGEARELAHLFMYDFDDRLRELAGSIPSRQMLVETALEYLQGVSAERGHDVDLARELAGAYQRVGDIQGGSRSEHLGDFNGALASYEKAQTILAALVAEHPSRDDLKLELARCELRIGDALKSLGRHGEAMKRYEGGLRAVEALAAAAPGDGDLQRDVAVMLREVAESYQSHGRIEDAVPLHERSLAIRTQLARGAPEDERAQRDLSGGLFSMATLLQHQDRRDEAMDRLDESLVVRRRLSRQHPESARYARDLVVALRFRGQILTELRRPDEAIEALAEARATTERLRAADAQAAAFDDAESVRLAAGHAQVLEAMGDAHLQRRDLKRASECYERYLAEAEALARRSPSYEGYLPAAHLRLAAVAALGGQFSAAAVHDEVAVRTLGNLTDASSRTSPMLVFALCQLAEHLREAGRAGDAWPRLVEAQRIVETESLSSFKTDVLHQMSATRAAEGAADQALAYAERAIALVDEPTAVMLHDRAVAYALLGETDRAAAFTEQAMAMLDASKGHDEAELRAKLEADLARLRGQ